MGRTQSVGDTVVAEQPPLTQSIEWINVPSQDPARRAIWAGVTKDVWILGPIIVLLIGTSSAYLAWSRGNIPSQDPYLWLVIWFLGGAIAMGLAFWAVLRFYARVITKLYVTDLVRLGIASNSVLLERRDPSLNLEIPLRQIRPPREGRSPSSMGGFVPFLFRNPPHGPPMGFILVPEEAADRLKQRLGQPG
jgi:hypothetical protein